MNKHIKSLSVIAVVAGFCLALSFSVKAQSTVTGNAFAAGRFLGWNTTSGDLLFRTNNVDRMVLKNTTGNFGIGTTTTVPTARLHVRAATATSIVQILCRGVQGVALGEEATLPTTFGSPYLQVGGIEFRTNSIQTIGFGYHTGINNQPAEIGFVTTNTSAETLGDIVFANRNVTTNTPPVEVMRITSSGNVGIGTTAPAAQYKLSVKGAIRCEKVVVEINWADYVFNKEYKLMTIDELEKFVTANKHLPNIPTGSEIEKNGLDIGSVQAKQMEKIEELALYIIELNKRIAELEKVQAKK